jgi:tetratricopeptide (TPR) repeat protein
MRWRLGYYTEARTDFAQAYEIASNPKTFYKSLLAELYLSDAEMALSELKYKEAVGLALKAIDAAGAQYKNVAIAARYTLGMAQALSGAKREAISSCQEALDEAKGTGDEALLSRAMLAFAEASYESGDTDAALDYAAKAQERFERYSQWDSEWRAWLVAARSNLRRGDSGTAQQQLARASDVLSKLRQNWGAETYDSYIFRPDIKSALKQLDEAYKVEQKNNQ